MKQKPGSLRTIIPAALGLFLLADTAFLARDAQGRAGRGESYRSSGGSSDRSFGGSSGRDLSDRYRSHLNDSSTQRESAARHSMPVYVPKDYDEDFTFNTWSATLAVNRDGSVDAVETFDVNTGREQKGIVRPVPNEYNPLLITEVSCPQGNASYQAAQTGSTQIAFGYADRKPAGRQVFTLKYRALGMVVPAGDGARFQVREMPHYHAAKMGSITIVLPPVAAPAGVKAVEVKKWDKYIRSEADLPCAVAGNRITVTINREIYNPVDIVADLPAAAVDRAALRVSLLRALETSKVPALAEYRSRMTVNGDRTIDRADAYVPAKENDSNNTRFWYDASFNSAFFPEGSTAENPQFVDNRHYLYAFDKKACDSDNYNYGSACVPVDRSGKAQTDIRYSAWGNFNPGEPFFFEFRLPPAGTKLTDRVRFEVAFPLFVKKEQVKTVLYLARFIGAEVNMLRTVAFDGTWEGNTLKGEYPASLVAEQVLVLRTYLPAAGFVEPGPVKKALLKASSTWYFDRLVFIAVAGALATVPLLLLVIIIRVKKKVSRTRPSPARTARSGYDTDIVEAVRADDPAFSPEAFLERAGAIAAKIQEAWSGGSMAPVRALVSQGVYNRLRLQLKLMREQEQLVNLVDGFRVNAISIVGSSLSHAYQTLHVQVNASARDITVPASMPAEEKRSSLARAMAQPFTEVYSYTRKRGAKTDASKNIIAGQCPSCGAVPESAGDSNKCRSCGTVYSSGEFDWVLSEITQGVEWKPGSAADVPGLTDLEKENLSINRGVIEDRASYLFWRWITCTASGDGKPLARDATERFMEAFRPAPGHLAEIAVGSVDLLQLDSTGATVRATVLVLWSGAFAPGKVPEHREHVLTLTMPLLMKNPYGFADHGCDSCGAPLPESDAATCAYCGGALQKVNSDWLLETVAERK
jgi:hypothetical protein